MFARLRRTINSSPADLLTAPLTTGGIPKIVHVVWIGKKPFPYRENFATWKEHNPDYEVRLWTDRNLPHMHNQWILDALAVNPTIPIAAQVDLIRLELLHAYGGIYTDADSWCTKPIAPLVDGLTLFGMTGNRGNVQNATLGAVPHHPAYRTICAGAGARYLRLAYLERNVAKGYEIFDLFGTRYITPILRGFHDFHQVDNGAVKGTRKLICVQGQDELDDAYIVHSNDVSWKTGQRITLQPARPVI